MKKKLTLLILGSIVCFGILAGCSGKKENDKVESSSHEKNPIATINIKDFGTVKVELYPNVAPNTVDNFVSLANKGYYDGLIFHRIIDGFMIQGGDPTGTGTGGPGYTIEGEFSKNGFKNDLKHEKGVISMARTNSPDTAGSQFFIMTEDAVHLDGQYAAFGKVIEGLDVIEKVGKVQTGANDKPVSDVIIESITIDSMGEEYSEPQIIK